MRSTSEKSTCLRSKVISSEAAYGVGRGSPDFRWPCFLSIFSNPHESQTSSNNTTLVQCRQKQRAHPLTLIQEHFPRFDMIGAQATCEIHDCRLLLDWFVLVPWWDCLYLLESFSLPHRSECIPNFQICFSFFFLF